MLRCGNCGQTVSIILRPLAKNAAACESTIICHRCDLIRLWPNTIAALGKKAQ